MFEVMRNALSGIWVWLIQTLQDWVWATYDRFLAVIYQYGNATWGALAPSVGPYLDYIGLVNAWVPVDFGLVLLTGYLTFTLLFAGGKIVIKMIPMVG